VEEVEVRTKRSTEKWRKIQPASQFMEVELDDGC
jgi:hypothetical protein